jgi:hypothetical protein
MKSGVLLVDAYNGACTLDVFGVASDAHACPFRRCALHAVINEWPKCAVLFAAGNLAAARDILIAELQGYAAFRGARPALVKQRRVAH